MTQLLHRIVFVVGLAAVCWVGFGYIGAHPLALAVTVLIGAFYVAGALELHRFGQATATLAKATAELSAPPSGLGEWLDRLHPSLRNAVRLRVEGERVGLPGPSLTPYLAGLLVLLGMLGTFLGMVVTLNGTGTALEGAADLQAMRASLAAPVKGLGVAFGTSLAGVATSAALGLLSALSRRERMQAGQLLDTRIATTLRGFSMAHQREESFRLLQRQGEAMPALVDRLQLMMATMERQSQALNERLVSSQDSFHGKAEAVYAGLAASVGQSLKEGLADSARIAGATIQPVVEATMAGIAREAASLHDTIGQNVQRQLDGLSTRFEASAATVADIWKTALAGQQRTSEAQAGDLRGALEQFTQTFEQRSAALVEGVAGRLDGLSSRFEASTGTVAEIWTRALDGQQRTSEAQAQDLRATLDRFAQTFEQRSAALVEGVSARLDDTAERVSGHWRSALAEHERASQALSGDTQRALGAAAAAFEQHSASLLGTVGQAHADLQAETAARDQQRLAAWAQALEAMAASLREEWRQAGARSESQQQEICRTLAQTASDISAQSEAHARSTIAEIGQLMQAAAEAPRAAADVIAELRQKLSDSMARDNAMLDERARILGTLQTLLDAVNHASGEQRGAIDALVATSADLLERVGTRFTDQVGAQTGKMSEVAAHITGGAVEVASLGEAFGEAVKLFAESNDRMGAQLQRIEAALGKSIARSDEQLAYYVAQAREVVDLSILSQRQIVEDLQQLAGRREPRDDRDHRAVAASEA